MQKDKKWFVYILNSTDDTLYTGITTDIARRLIEHSNSNKGAKYFRGRKPKALLYVQEFIDRSTASIQEATIKKMKRSDKQKLISSKANELAIYLMKQTTEVNK